MDNEVFEIVDFTTASPFERLIKSLEATMVKFNIANGLSSYTQSEQIIFSPKMDLQYWRIPKIHDRPEAQMRDLLVGTIY
jgi:hypothetical protein